MKTLMNVTVLLESKKFKVLIEKFKGYVVWHDNLLGVSNAHYVGRYFEHHIVTFNLCSIFRRNE